jgi:ribonuclease HI
MCTTSVECFDRCSHSPPGEVQAFTDGSRKDEVTGAACVLFEENLNGVFVASDKYAENLGEIATVFQAEVYAIIMATEALEERVRNDEEGKIKTLRIVSDSASAIAAMGSFTTNSGLVLECRKRLSSLGRKRLLTLQWVKAHNGDEANELVDSWAKYATTLSRDKVEPFLPVPKTWLRKKTKEFVCQLWKERWKAQPQARQTKIFFSEPNEKLSRSILKLSRQTYGEIFRWISGHNFLKRHRSLLEPLIYPDSTCRACLEEEETSSHLIMQCPAFGQARHGIFGQHLLPEITEWTVSQLWRMIGVTRRLCPEFLPEQVEIQVVPDVGAEESVPEEG